MVDAEFLGDRQGVIRGSSVIKVVDGDWSHGREG